MERRSGVWPEADRGRRGGWRLRCSLPRSATRALYLIASEKFPGELEIGLGSPGTGIVERNGLTVAGRFRKPDIAGNHSDIEPLAEVLTERAGNLLSEVGSVVVHGQEDALDADVWIERRADALERRDEFGDSLEGKILGLHGHNEGFSSYEDIQGEEVERGRAIEDDEIESILNRLQGAAKTQSAIGGRSQLNVGAGEVLGAGKMPEQIDLRGEDDLDGRDVAHEDVIDGVAVIVPLEAHAGRGVGLRVAVDKQDFETFERDAGGQVDSRGGFANSALLIDNAQNSSHGIQE